METVTSLIETQNSPEYSKMICQGKESILWWLALVEIYVNPNKLLTLCNMPAEQPKLKFNWVNNKTAIKKVSYVKIVGTLWNGNTWSLKYHKSIIRNSDNHWAILINDRVLVKPITFYRQIWVFIILCVNLETKLYS